MTWLDILMLIVCCASLIAGFMTGLIMQVTTLIGIILGAIFAGEAAEWISPYLEQLATDSSGSFIRPLSYIFGFLLIVVAVYIIGWTANKLAKIVLLGLANRLTGALFCFLKWILIMSILLNITVQFDKKETLITEEVRNNSHSYPMMIKLAQQIIPYLRFENFSSIDTNNSLDLDIKEAIDI